jgi:glycerophosphoryl diester phosphodiesterase
MRRTLFSLGVALCLLPAAARADVDTAAVDRVELVGRAVLPANTFAKGPTSGRQLGSAPINGVQAPFVNKQPVLGFSAVLDNGDGTFLAMPDNGFGALENSADFRLRVYKIRPRFETALGGRGRIEVRSFIELRDPDRHIPFAITEAFSAERALTGADFDIESVQRASDGTLWFGDEFGPVLLHTDATGRVLEAPIPLPDFERGGEIRSPQNPFAEEGTVVRIMNAVRDHARRNGNADAAPIVSPSHLLLADRNPLSFEPSREAPEASGLTAASSEVFDVAQLKAAGYPVVPYTVNDEARMRELIALGVNGIISDRSDLLFRVVASMDLDNDGIADFLTPDGLIDDARFSAQGHRGSRDLRPENTLPAMEAGLDNLMSTLETDTGVSLDKISLLNHNPSISAQTCRRADGLPYTASDELLLRSLTAREIQTQFICDKVFRGPSQSNDRALSPVAVAFAAEQGLIDPYVMPTAQQLFDFVAFYAEYYATGPGSSEPQAELRARNAARVRFNLETKINPRQAARTFGPEEFVTALAGEIAASGLAARADIQSFDFRTLLDTQARFPEIRTVYLFGDFPTFDDPTLPDSDDSTNLQSIDGENTPWMAGLAWPYRSTALAQPFRARRSGGFEGMAVSPDGTKLVPLLEQPLVGAPAGQLLAHVFDTQTRSYTGRRFTYALDARGTAIGDFILTSENQGIAIERDNSQGDLGGFKALFQVELPALQGDASLVEPVQKSALVDLLAIADPFALSLPAQPGDVGLGTTFAFPFTTIEDVVVLRNGLVGVINDNNFPTSVGRHVGTGAPDDTEFIVLRLPEPALPTAR